MGGSTPSDDELRVDVLASTLQVTYASRKFCNLVGREFNSYNHVVSFCDNWTTALDAAARSLMPHEGAKCLDKDGRSLVIAKFGDSYQLTEVPDADRFPLVVCSEDQYLDAELFPDVEELYKELRLHLATNTFARPAKFEIIGNFKDNPAVFSVSPRFDRDLETLPAPAAVHDASEPVPENGWQYVDKKNRVQGPFTSNKMAQWYKMGYFRSNLLVRCDPDDSQTSGAASSWVQLRELFPPGSIPFVKFGNQSFHDLEHITLSLKVTLCESRSSAKRKKRRRDKAATGFRPLGTPAAITPQTLGRSTLHL